MTLPLNEEILAALKTLQKYNFKEAELILRQEAGLVDNQCAEELLKFKAQVKDEPATFGDKYNTLLKFIDKVPDNHKLELSSLLYPIFVHLYLRLISGGLYNEAKTFLETYRKYQEDFYQSDIILLANITDSDQLLLNPLVETFKSSEFVVSVAATSYALLKPFLQENNLHVIQSILNEQLSVQVIDGPPRTRLQFDCRRGALFGEAAKDANRDPVLYGLLPDPSLVVSLGPPADASQTTGDGSATGGDHVDDDAEGDQTPVKKRKRREGLSSSHSGSISGSSVNRDGRKATDSNSPALDRIPLPKLSETFIESRQTLARETAALLKSHRQSQKAIGTSVVLYTVCNIQAGESTLAIRRGGVTCASFTDNSGWLAAGFGSGRIRVWSLGPESLRRMLPATELALLDKDDSRVKTKMLHDENDETHPTRDLLGHVGSVHGVAFSSDRQLLVSGGSDGTVRLWSSLLWGGALTVWRDHLLPVWCVTWAPVYGHYVATGGADRSAHLYATDHSPDALRVFIGHRSDVTAVTMHPNVNYLATGSADRAVRLFDVRSGKLVRLYTGHKGSVQALAFSPCGRYLASGGWCGAVCIWDLGTGHQVGQLGGYSATTTSSILQYQQRNTELSTTPNDCGQWLTGPIVSLAYCPDNSGRLAAGGLDGALHIWDISTGRSSTRNQSSSTTADQAAAPNTSQSTVGLIAMHRTSKQQIVRGQTTLGAVNPNFLSYYSPVIGPTASDTCLHETFFTRRTSILGLQYVHPYLLLAAGPYNQS
ncbi:Transcription initiation factor TFIID subunit 5 [Paragonimus heterotremus]|uniref:Transcription initiation factor TFIID subunit 5 n=1 Tax=Paragonimus heterotremus TaxID=100268 RepID=A0A8J4T3Q0_9TREM|nr:Transcription initiation factor TFIID subunit 5 [Paragonimus heterotremus]